MMKNIEQKINLRYRQRCLSYFDLLGFSNIIRDNKIEHIIPLYEEVLKFLHSSASTKIKYGLDYSWFSDTFLLFTKGDTEGEFSLIEQASRLFFEKLITNHIPVRGSLTIGEFYTQKEKNIFLGKALVEAYEYGETQNWLGFILTPSVYEYLSNSNTLSNQLSFYTNISSSRILEPKTKTTKQLDSNNVLAFNFRNKIINDESIFLRHIQQMKDEVPLKYQEKYKNTEMFIKTNVA